jgi:hypothetical protein
MASKRPSFGSANFVDYFQFHFSWQRLNVMISMHAIKETLHQPQNECVQLLDTSTMNDLGD